MIIEDESFMKGNNNLLETEDFISNDHVNDKSIEHDFRKPGLVESGEKKTFFCDTCFKTFVSKGSLKLHAKSVHEKIRYSCSECTHQATTKGNLKAHTKNVHSESHIDELKSIHDDKENKREINETLVELQK